MGLACTLLLHYKHLKILATAHNKMFDAIHIKKGKEVKCSTLKQCANTYAKFVNKIQPDISIEKFSKLFTSFGILNQINRSKQLAKNYQITGVPVFVIAGKYITNMTMAGSLNNLFEIIEMLADEELNNIK